MKPPVVILRAAGTNRELESLRACENAGGAPEIVHTNRVVSGEKSLRDYRMLVIPGGFSHGDDLGAGKLWSVLLRHRLGEQLEAFVAAGRPVLGICNGFQVLVKARLLPWSGAPLAARPQLATLTHNASGRFECRWVQLQPDPLSPCVFTRGLRESIHCPAAHGEGRFVARDPEVLAELEADHLVALRYLAPDGSRPAGYPGNPNGSDNDIAGICSPSGTVFGLMPHPEDHLDPLQHPRRHRGERHASGLGLFENGIRHAAEL